MSNIYTAFQCSAFPSNPQPFLRELMSLAEQGGEDALKTDKAKKVLFIINAMAYGQLAMIDMHAEWCRLNDTPEDGEDNKVAA